MAVPPSSPYAVPPTADVWDLTLVPVQLQGKPKKEAVKRGDTERWMTPGKRLLARWAYKRMSTKVAQG